ncbi:hypothetical protein [Aquisphaera insulae]|uniref:hypothetical protein n=1 Tax=Aquisphaera insulae TaxID=2712864 RepID=UPI0013EBDD34|nr:hypothetical protein [Aquisphaera insulae]
MPGKRLPLHKLGDHSAYGEYIELFRRTCLGKPIVDPLGREVEFPPYAYAHICLKPRPHEAGYVSVEASWQADRAERIGWIEVALRDPDEIRPNHQFRSSRNQAYLLTVEPDVPEARTTEFFYVTVQPEGAKVVFLSAFPVDHRYWRDARKGGKALYRRVD